MRRRLAENRVTIQPEKLPPSFERTELDYRTRVTTPRQDTATTLRLLSLITLTFIVFGFGLRLLTVFPFFAGVTALVVLALASLGYAYARFLRRMPPADDLLMALAFLAVGFLFGLVNFAPTTTSAYVIIFGVAVAAAAVLSHFITLQVCYFMAVNERMRLRTLRRYQRYWWFVPTLKTPRRCPEISAYRLSFLALSTAFLMGFGLLVLADTNGLSGYAAMLGVVGFLATLPVLWVLMDASGLVPPASIPETARVAWWALTTFVCYNRHQVEAAGLFRFPTRGLRHPFKRVVAIGVSLALTTTALVGVSVSSPWVLIERYATPRGGSVAPQLRAAANAEASLTPAEELFAGQLPPGQRAQYVAAKKYEHRARVFASTGEGIKRAVIDFAVATAAVLLLCWLGPGVIFFAVFWFTAGRLLARYYRALEAPHAYEKPYVPTKEELRLREKSMLPEHKRGFTPWANRIERIVSSYDRLEREHFYLGPSLEGDFPVLVHQDLLLGHAHIMGETGSRVTSAGVAPLLTQLIARESTSVVILDLHGDHSLFTATKDEADRTGFPFRWVTDMVGRSSYGFNFFEQGHVSKMTADQLAQGILQALSLEHREDTRRQKETTINEQVLTAYLRRYRKNVTSFAKLHGYLTDQNAYQGMGPKEDWEEARHLASLIEKLGRLTPLNVTKADAKEMPRVVAERIDMASVLETPQVVYFSLSSDLNPRTASAVARLVMFSLLTAARLRGGTGNRVFVFVDGFERVISEATQRFFEDGRRNGLHFILANQTIGQLHAKDVSLVETVEANTRFKQTFRATDEKSIKHLIETSGEGLYHSAQWTQLLGDDFNGGDDAYLSLREARRQSPNGYAPARVSETVGPRLEKNTIIEVSARPLASFVKFTEASGYTQHAGYWTTVLSEYHITEALYEVNRETPWPPVDDRTVEVRGDGEEAPEEKFIGQKPTTPKPTSIPAAFEDDLEKRLEAEAEQLIGKDKRA